jgi:ribosome modulation factor
MSEADFTRALPVPFSRSYLAEDEGFEAFVAGKSAGDNPYRYHRDINLSWFWLGGFLMARRYYGR